MIGIGLSPVIGPAYIWTPQRLRAAYPGLQEFVPLPGRVFTDTAATTPATFGQGVGGLRDGTSAIVATQSTSDARPTYGRHPASGLRNRLPNNRMDGASVGVVGSGGALPTGWAVGNLADAAIEVLSLAPKNGRPNIRLRFSGTPGGGNIGIQFENTSTVAASQGQVWTISAWVQLVGGSSATIDRPRMELSERNAGGTQINSTNVNFADSFGDDLRRGSTRTLASADAAFVAGVLRLILVDEQDPVDITLDISAPQLEQAAEASTVQIVGAGGFDITEAGQRSVYYLAPDGVDDWMEFVTDFEPAGAYTVAVASQRIGDSFEPFGGASSQTRYAYSTAAGGRMDFRIAGGTGNQLRVRHPSLLDQRNIAIVRSAAVDDIAAFFNGEPPTVIDETPDPASPIGGFSRLFRYADTYTAGRFYGGVMIPGAITEAERLALQRYLASISGVTLA